MIRIILLAGLVLAAVALTGCDEPKDTPTKPVTPTSPKPTPTAQAEFLGQFTA